MPSLAVEASCFKVSRGFIVMDGVWFGGGVV